MFPPKEVKKNKKILFIRTNLKSHYRAVNHTTNSHTIDGHTTVSQLTTTQLEASDEQILKNKLGPKLQMPEKQQQHLKKMVVLFDFHDSNTLGNTHSEKHVNSTLKIQAGLNLQANPQPPLSPEPQARVSEPHKLISYHVYHLNRLMDNSISVSSVLCWRRLCLL